MKIKMQITSLIASACLLFSLYPFHANAAEENRHIITSKTHGPSTFTFRDGKLLHELTKLSDTWSEIFYNGVAPVYVRSGHFKANQPVVTSERYTGKAAISVQQVSNPGDDHPRRIYVGSEIYNRSPSGFFELMPDPKETIKESVLMGMEYSTKELEEMRKRLLHMSQDD